VAVSGWRISDPVTHEVCPCSGVLEGPDHTGEEQVE
jgi:hypothetical protein